MRFYIHLTLTDAFRLVFVKVNYVRLIFFFFFCVKLFDSSGKMSDVVKLKKRRAYVRGTINSILNQLKEMFNPGATASPSESLVLSLISDVEEKLKTVDEFTSEICFELDDELMQEEVENNSKYVLSVKTQICMYRDSFPNKCSQNNANVENCNVMP